MGPREIGHRIAEQVAVQRLRWAAPGDDAPAPGGLAFCTAREPQLPEPDFDFDARAARDAGLADGRWPALGFEWRWTADPACWHLAPDTGRHWPRDFFGSIPYRAGNPTGDVRVAWEPSRLQQLVGLALLARAGDGQDAARLLEDQLVSWVAANPPYRGIHWVSAMECGLRIVATCHALDLARDRLTRPDEAWAALARLVRSHAELISRRLSLHSSAGNHTIAEAAGLFYAGTLFPELAGAPGWRASGLALLAAEADRQVLPDGGGLEQSFWYLGFVTDLGSLACALLAHRGERPPAALAAAVARGRAFRQAMADDGGTLFDVGDRDDGYALGPWLAPVRPAQPCRRRTFADAGYTRLRSGGLDVLLDHGPLGMAPLFAHGHADALAVIVRIGGRERLVDPGTFTYNGDPAWRRYFRSTAAHNTVSVDGEDQALQQGAFAWSRPFECALVRAEETPACVRLLARHDGFRRLGAVHWRGIALRDDAGLLVWDCVTGEGEHEVTVNWQLAGDAVIDIAGADAVDEERGGASGGWRSARYGRREPMLTLRARRRGALPCEMTSVVPPREGSADALAFREDVAAFREWMRTCAA